MKAALSYLKSRGRLLGATSTLALLVTCAGPRIDERSENGLRRALGKRTTKEVGVMAWEPRRSLLGEFFMGRPLLFEARGPAERRDIYRAFVRLAPNGSPLGVTAIRNLSQTSLADEVGLTVSGPLALYATEESGRIHSLTVLRLDGEASERGLGLGEHVRLALSRALQSGDFRGLGRSDLYLTHPSSRAHVEEREGQLVFELDQARFQVPRTQLLDPRAPLSPAILEHLSVVHREAQPSSFLQWSADTARSLVGPGPVAWLEGRVFSSLDEFHQLTRGRSRPRAEPQPAGIAPKRDATTSPQLPATRPWPPAPLPPLFTPADAREGQWQPFSADFLPDAARHKPYFYRTFLRPDPKRPYAELHLVVMDTRRLDLGMRAGYEDPHPETGPPGSGQVPDDPSVYRRIVATFNGAFKAVHGPYGMHAEGRLLVPAHEGAATVRVDLDGRIGFGDWPASSPPAHHLTAPLEPGQATDFRQNLDPLVADGLPNPKKRTVWGDHLYGSLVPAERSALCVTRDGELVYAWSPEITGDVLADALVHAQCLYALHLDMNPGHCTFAVNQVQSLRPLVARGLVLDPRMKVNANRYLRWSPQDFFYLAQRTAIPLRSNLRWEVTPAAVDLPAARGLGTSGGLEFEMDRVALDSVLLTIQAGHAEDDRPVVPHEAAPSDLLIAWGLGHRTQGSRPGLLLGQETIVPLHRAYASLRLAKTGDTELLPPGVPVLPTENVDVVQLPVLARDGALAQLARELGGQRRRAALCLQPSGHLLVGRMTHDTIAPLVQAMLAEGCSLVVALDRGSHHHARVERAGSPVPPELEGLESILLGRARPLLPRGYQFQ